MTSILSVIVILALLGTLIMTFTSVFLFDLFHEIEEQMEKD